jgi:PKD repeat protein
MKFSLKNMYKTTWVLLSALAMLFIVSCGDDDDPMTSENPIASFQFEIDATNFLQVTFTNFSQNANSYSWDFGDGESSTEDNPVHTYSEGGTYTVVLTASNGTESATRSETITITNPDSALQLLTGETSKTWKLFREGTSMSLWADQQMSANYWPGLTNNGARPCLYQQEITFGADGSYTFDDKGEFWAEFGVFNNVEGCGNNTDESCFEATAANMVNACGDDVSAWLSGTHQFDYNSSTGSLTLTGTGAWIGIPKLTTSGESITPVNTITTQISIEEFDGYDVMLVEFIYDGTYWPIYYASYSDASLEPELETEEVVVEFGEDLPDASPASITHTFMEAGSDIDTITAASFVEYGVEDPADATATCGLFIRTAAQFQELQFQTVPEKNDINFENLTTVSVDVYMPGANDYSGALENKVIIGFADKSKTEQWWTDQMEYITTDLALDEWVTISFNLSDMPTFVAQPDTAMNLYERNDYDMIYLQIGGGNHMETANFYVRNLRFE